MIDPPFTGGRGSQGETELVERYLPLAYTLAREWYLPGSDLDDVRQEALIALLDAARRWRPGEAPFSGFACFVIRRQLVAKLRGAQRFRHQVLSEAVRNDWDMPGPDFDELIEQRERLAAILAALDTLTPFERASLRHVLNGGEYIGDKSIDNALQRGREKLRAAAA